MYRVKKCLTNKGNTKYVIQEKFLWWWKNCTWESGDKSVVRFYDSKVEAESMIDRWNKNKVDSLEEKPERYIDE